MRWHIISTKRYREALKRQRNKGKNEGLIEGYELGFLMGQVEKSNRVLASYAQLKKQSHILKLAEDILRGKQ